MLRKSYGKLQSGTSSSKKCINDLIKSYSLAQKPENRYKYICQAIAVAVDQGNCYLLMVEKWGGGGGGGGEDYITMGKKFFSFSLAISISSSLAISSVKSL